MFTIRESFVVYILKPCSVYFMGFVCGGFGEFSMFLECCENKGSLDRG